MGSGQGLACGVLGAAQPVSSVVLRSDAVPQRQVLPGYGYWSLSLETVH